VLVSALFDSLFRKFLAYVSHDPDPSSTIFAHAYLLMIVLAVLESFEGTD
jgi:hypothetical protein